VSDVTRICTRLLVAVALGGLLGYEREAVGAAAGLRTHMMVAVGSALFVLVPQQAGMPMEDISRVIQGIAAGIGFLGAGAILKQKEVQAIKGLTTAAGIWPDVCHRQRCGLGTRSGGDSQYLFSASDFLRGFNWEVQLDELRREGRCGSIRTPRPPSRSCPECATHISPKTNDTRFTY
jgi:putative Mg2+ transporter-C (MgtC) family protein